MENVIRVVVANNGIAVGTIGWWNQLLDGAELRISNNKENTPCMWLVTVTPEGKKEYRFICKPYSGDGFLDVDYSETTPISVVRPVSGRCYHDGLFDYPLTPACLKSVQSLIDKAVVEFREWFEKN